MTPADWQRIKDLFAEALEKPADAREDFLKNACGGRSDIFDEVVSLIAASSEPENLIENNSYDLASKIVAQETPISEQHFGRYKIIREIGSGGMGTVFLAERNDGEFVMEVALKIVRQSVAHREIIERFKRERQILADLNHPNIAVLHDGGISEKGEPYLAMEYVDGESLIEYAAAHKLSITDRLRLFLKVCAAVSYAHRNLVVHRDIKPSNILVTHDGEPKLLDFGLAKAFDTNYLTTQTALRAFTPAYASPEQIQGRNITTLSDIYSLGVVFYELLTGTKPLNVENKSFDEILKTVNAAEPVKPSSVEDKDGSGVSHKVLRGDLDNIALTALRKEPERRFKTVDDLAADIERHIAGRPISARPNTVRYLAGKFVQRNKILVAATSVILISIVVGTAFVFWQANIARYERDRARVEAEKSARISEFLQKLMLAANPNWNSPGFGRSNDVKLVEVIDEAAKRVNTEFLDQPESLAKLHHSLGLIYAYRGRYAEGESEMRAAYETSRQLYGEERAETVQVARDLAGVLLLKGNYDEANELFQKALLIYPKLLDSKNNDRTILLGLAGTLSDVGYLLRLKGEPEAAEPFLLESLLQSQNFTGGERAVVAIPLAHLGMALYDQGDLDGAERYVRQSLEEFQNLPGNTRMESGRTMLNLASILVARGDYAQAEIQVRSCLDLYHRVLGDSHPYTANAMSQLGELERRQGNYAGAEEATAAAIAVYRAMQPTGHPNLAYALTTLGLIQAERGQAANGEKNLREALTIRERVMREDSWLVAETKGALGEVLLDQKRYSEAEPYIRGSLESLQRSQKSENNRLAAARQRLARLEAGQ